MTGVQTCALPILRAQVADLERAADDLRTAIRRLEREMAQRFERAFRAVHEAFRRYFTDLFGGGTARLVPLDGADGQDGGVEIIAQPPGKKLQNIHLLSGGEKTLAALALILALFQYKPSPFCILDEVDAALDDTNVARFSQVVQEISRSVQFILITHNKQTMEIADTLFGVTMESPGVSSVVSVQVQ